MSTTADAGDEDWDEWYEAYKADRAARRAAPTVVAVPEPVTSWALYATANLHTIGSSPAKLRVAFGGEIVPVRLVEDPEGTHFGLVDPAGMLVMVRRGRARFEAQFTYGSAETEAHGGGRVVRLRVETARPAGSPS